MEATTFNNAVSINQVVIGFSVLIPSKVEFKRLRGAEERAAERVRIGARLRLFFDLLGPVRLNRCLRRRNASDGAGFACRKEDMGAWKPGSRDSSRHAIQEAQANRFAIEVLAPRKFFKGFLQGIPDLDAVLRLSSSLDLGREAVAHRYVELHDQPIALVFSCDGVRRYFERNSDFPALTCRRGARTPALPLPVGVDNLSGHEEADWRDWLRHPPDADLVVQTLHQRDSFAMTLLAFDRSERHDEVG